MKHKYSIAEARSNLSKIIDEAASGHRVEVTRRGLPVAVIVSCQEMERLEDKRPNFGTLYDALLKDVSLEEVGLDEGFADSLRDRDPGREVSF